MGRPLRLELENTSEPFGRLEQVLREDAIEAIKICDAALESGRTQRVWKCRGRDGLCRMESDASLSVINYDQVGSEIEKRLMDILRADDKALPLDLHVFERRRNCGGCSYVRSV